MKQKTPPNPTTDHRKKIVKILYIVYICCIYITHTVLTAVCHMPPNNHTGQGKNANADSPRHPGCIVPEISLALVAKKVTMSIQMYINGRLKE